MTQPRRVLRLGRHRPPKVIIAYRKFVVAEVLNRVASHLDPARAHLSAVLLVQLDAHGRRQLLFVHLEVRDARQDVPVPRPDLRQRLTLRLPEQVVGDVQGRAGR